MKLAVSGKGGVGKTAISSALALLYARRGRNVLAVDADPDANMALTLGISPASQKDIIPISEQAALIEERTGAKVKQYGQMFKLNPRVSDIADTYAVRHNGVDLLVMGAVPVAGGGCACPENVLLRALVTDLVLNRDETLILDMEAGIEHLGRATARGVDTMLVVVEPGQSSIDCAVRVEGMCAELGMKHIVAVANKVENNDDLEYVKSSLNGMQCIGSIPYSRAIRANDRPGRSIIDGIEDGTLRALESLADTIEQLN